MKKIYIEGHRGLCAYYPENTLISYEAAINAGVDAIEFDVWLSKDKVPVLMHDGNAFRTAGVNKNLRDMTLDEIKKLDPHHPEKFGDKFKGKTEVPTFKELLELRKKKNPSLKLGVEIKEYTEETVDITIAMLKEYGISITDDCWFYAFNARIIKYIKTRYNGRTMGYPDFQMQEFEADSYSYYDEMGLSMRVLRSEVADVYLGKGLPVHMYCADTKEDVEFCISKGANLITANDVEPLFEILGK